MVACFFCGTVFLTQCTFKIFIVYFGMYVCLTVLFLFRLMTALMFVFIVFNCLQFCKINS